MLAYLKLRKKNFKQFSSEILFLEMLTIGALKISLNLKKNNKYLTINIMYIRGERKILLQTLGEGRDGFLTPK